MHFELASYAEEKCFQDVIDHVLLHVDSLGKSLVNSNKTVLLRDRKRRTARAPPPGTWQRTGPPPPQELQKFRTQDPSPQELQKFRTRTPPCEQTN